MMIESAAMDSLKQLKTPKSAEMYMKVICTNDYGPFHKGYIYQLSRVNLHTVELDESHTISYTELYDNFKPFAWTPSKKPGYEKATIYPWKKGNES